MRVAQTGKCQQRMRSLRCIETDGTRLDKPAVSPKAPTAAKRMMITRTLLDKYGATDHSKGCIASTLGLDHDRHSEDCRMRIMFEMEADPVDKLKERRRE